MKICLVSLIVGLVILRVSFLLSVPVFGDESLYLSLADQVNKNFPGDALASIKFGVMPLFVWIIALLNLLTFNLVNPLLLGRLINVIFDIISAFLVYKIGKKLFGETEGVLSGLVYLTLPLNFFISRMVLLEPATNLFALAGIYLFIGRIADPPRNNVKSFFPAAGVAFFLLLSFFTKPLVALYLSALLFSPFLVIKNFKFKQEKPFYLFLTNLFFILFIFFLVSFTAYFFTAKYFSRYIYSSANFFDVLNTAKFKLLKTRLWLDIYATVPLLVFFGVSNALGLIKGSKQVIFLGLWFFGSLILAALLASNFYPRHLYPLAAPFALITGYGAGRLRILGGAASFAAIFLVFFLPVNRNFSIAFNPAKAWIAPEDRQQYYEDWTSGAGLKEMSGVINNLAKEKEIVVFTDNAVNEEWVFIRLYPVRNAEFVVLKDLNDWPKVLDGDSGKERYILFNRNPKTREDPGLEEIVSFNKGPNRTMSLYYLTPPFPSYLN